MSIFSFRFRLQECLQNYKDSNSSIEKVDGVINNISRRYGSFNRRIGSGSGWSGISSTEFGFLNKYKDINLTALPNLRVSSYGNNIKGLDFDTSREEEEEQISRAMSIFIEEIISEYQRVDSGYWLFGINSYSRSASTSTVLSYAALAGTGVFHGFPWSFPCFFMGLQFSSTINREGESRTELLSSKKEH